MRKNSDKTIVNWQEDAYGNNICQLNEPGLMAKDSYLGRIFFRDGKWRSQMQGEEMINEHKSAAAARAFVQQRVNGRTVEEMEWDNS